MDDMLAQKAFRDVQARGIGHEAVKESKLSLSAQRMISVVPPAPRMQWPIAPSAVEEQMVWFSGVNKVNVINQLKERLQRVFGETVADQHLQALQESYRMNSAVSLWSSSGLQERITAETECPPWDMAEELYEAHRSECDFQACGIVHFGCCCKSDSRRLPEHKEFARFLHKYTSRLHEAFRYKCILTFESKSLPGCPRRVVHVMMITGQMTKSDPFEVYLLLDIRGGDRLAGQQHVFKPSRFPYQVEFARESCGLPILYESEGLGKYLASILPASKSWRDYHMTRLNVEFSHANMFSILGTLESIDLSTEVVKEMLEKPDKIPEVDKAWAKLMESMIKNPDVMKLAAGEGLAKKKLWASHDPKDSDSGAESSRCSGMTDDWAMGDSEEERDDEEADYDCPVGPMTPIKTATGRTVPWVPGLSSLLVSNKSAAAASSTPDPGVNDGDDDKVSVLSAASSGRCRPLEHSFKWGEFKITEYKHKGVKIGWECRCLRHGDMGDKKSDVCKSLITFGKAARGLDDGQCIIRLKRWLLEGMSTSKLDPYGRTVHHDIKPFDLSEGLSAEECDEQLRQDMLPDGRYWQ